MPERSTGVLSSLCIIAWLIGLSQGLGLIIRDCSITCNVGYRLSPLAFLALALCSAPFIILQVRWIQRWGISRWRVRSTLASALGLIGFRSLLYYLFRSSADPAVLRLVYLGFYVWIELSFAVLVSNLFGLLQANISNSEKYLGWIGASLYAGGLVGGIFAQYANQKLGEIFPGRFEFARDHLMIAMSLAIFLILPLLRQVNRPPERMDRDATLPNIGLISAIKKIARQRQLLFLGIGFISTGMATILLDYLFYWLLSTQGEGSNGFVQTLAKFYIWMNGLSFLMISIGTARLIRRLGLGFALLALPIALLTSTSYLLIRIALPVIYFIRVVEESLWGTLYEPATERLLLRIDRDEYDVIRPVLEGFMTRVGVGIGACIILLFSFGFELSLSSMVAVLLCFHAAWITFLIFSLSQAKNSAIRRSTA